MELKQLIKESRTKLNLSQEALAEALAVNVSTIQNWESARRQPDSTQFQNIIKTLKINPDAFLKALGNQLELFPNEELIHQEFKWGPLLPNDFSIKKVKDLYFTKEEQEMFLAISLSHYVNGNPIPELLKINPDHLTVMAALDKFARLGLFTNKYSTLTDIGWFVLRYIKKHPTELFNLYELSFAQFIEICLLSEIYPYLSERIDYLKELVEKKVIPLTLCEELNDFELSDYCRYNINSKHIWKEVQQEHLAFYAKTEEHWDGRVEVLYDARLDDSYYTTEETEFNHPDYLTGRETYLKKLDYYIKNREFIDELRHPDDFPFLSEKRAYPTPKAIAFVEELNK